jgi:pilus assembly protein CpaF
VGLIDRLSHELLNRDIPLDRPSLTTGLSSLLPEVAPLATARDIDTVVDGLVGLGPIEALLVDPQVTDVLVNRFDEIWVERDGELVRSGVSYSSPEAVRATIERIIAPLGLRLDRASPSVDARLADGSRLHAAIPPIAVDGPAFAIRRFIPAVRTFEDLVAAGSLTNTVADRLRESVRGRRNVLVSGGTGSGKTTLLNVLSTAIDSQERTITIEDSAELVLVGHTLRLEARPPNAEGAGEVSLRDLVRNALRLRPDRIVVGEVRGPEALDLISAMNTGHAGSMGTIHANGPEQALWRLETLAMSGDRRVGRRAIERQIRGAIHLVVHMERKPSGRRVESVHRLIDDGSLVFEC